MKHLILAIFGLLFLSSQAQTSTRELRQSPLTRLCFYYIPDSIRYDSLGTTLFFNYRQFGVPSELQLTDKEYLEYLVEFKSFQKKKRYESNH